MRCVSVPSFGSRTAAPGTRSTGCWTGRPGLFTGTQRPTLSHRAVVPATDGYDQRSLIYQLLWCFEYGAASARHAADTATLKRRLGLV